MDMSKRHCTRSQEKGTGQSPATIRSDSEAVPVPPVLPGPPSGQINNFQFNFYYEFVCTRFVISKKCNTILLAVEPV